MKLRDLDVALRNGGIGMWADGGWRERGAEMSGLKAIIVHHTAGGGSNDWVVVRDGRAGLAGPLSHLTLERDGGVRLLASGRCNHAGTGSHPRIGTNNANAWTIGIEGVSKGVGNDWTAAQRREYPRVCAALCRHYGLPAAAVIAHREWTSRKVDPQGFDMVAFRAEVQRHLAGVPAPAPTERTHVVAKGETLAAIGRRYGVTWEAIAQLNGLANPNAIREGQVLQIPAAAAPAPTPAATKSAAEVLRANGIVADPADVIAAAQAGGLELAVMASMLQKESYGGRNVFGNDKVAYPTSGPYTAATVDVTYEASQAYLRWRGPAPGAGSSGRQNGVGPGQLTWYSYQDDAERRGGLHVPRINMTVAAETFAGHVRGANGDVAEAGARYNGGANWRNAAAAKRDQAQKYGADLKARADHLRRELAGTTTEDDDMTPEQERLLREVHHQLLNKWPGWRWLGEGEQQPQATLVDYVRGLDQVVASRYTLAGRPIDPNATDTSTGQLLSLRAEVRALADRLDRLVDTPGGTSP